MSRDAWALAFGDALRELRPHLSLKLAWAVALVEYKDGKDPRAAARDYHKRTEAMEAPAAALAAKKRRK
ncbi:MAG TPA: hypothetical protein VFU71_09140 [Burkholderiaceae bacterium]|nr:hypothetical protein [Burkholderiaceae bacterium]